MDIHFKRLSKPSDLPALPSEEMLLQVSRFRTRLDQNQNQAGPGPEGQESQILSPVTPDCRAADNSVQSLLGEIKGGRVRNEKILCTFSFRGTKEKEAEEVFVVTDWNLIGCWGTSIRRSC